MTGADGPSVLGRLARRASRTDDTDATSPPTDYGETIERATAALDDLDAAATFVDETGLDHLESAVARAEADLSDCATTGRETLRRYRDFRAVARGGPGDQSDGQDRRV